MSGGSQPSGKLVPMFEEPAADTRSFDAFWAEQLGEAEHDTIRGVQVQVPKDMPLRLLRIIDREQALEATEPVVQRMAAELFGQDVVGQWIDAGMGVNEFRVVVRWGVEHAKGNPITWPQAYDLVMDEGKAPARRTRSASTGGRSRRTSTASTASTQPRSPA